MAVAQLRHPQGDALDGATNPANRHEVAYAVLRFEQNKDPGEEIAQQVLGAEADHQAGDAGRAEERTEVDPELVEHGRQYDHDHKRLRRVAHHVGQRLPPLEPVAGRTLVRPQQNALESTRKPADQRPRHRADHHDQRDIHRATHHRLLVQLS